MIALDSADADALVARIVVGDDAAWHVLWASVEPVLARVIANPRFLGWLGSDEDDRRDMIVAVMARLRADGCARLHRYLASRAGNPKLTFIAWLRVVTKRVGIDYLRAHPHYVRQCAASRSRPGRWVRPRPLPASHLLGKRAAMTTRLTARRILETTGPALPEAQRRAVELWSAGEDMEQIAAALGLASKREAERVVRAGLERLRRAYRA